MHTFDDPSLPVVVALVVCTAWFLRRLVRQKTPLLLGFTSALQFATSLLVVSLEIADETSIILHRILFKIPTWVPGEPHVTILGVPYDFRFYASMLFAAVLIVAGVKGMRAAASMTSHSLTAYKRAMMANGIVLLVCLPATPICGISCLLSFVSIVALVVLRSTRDSVSRVCRAAYAMSVESSR